MTAPHGDSTEPTLHPIDYDPLEPDRLEAFRQELEHDPQAEPRLRDEWFGRGYGVGWGVAG